MRIYALLSLLVDFCLRAFRRDVFESIQSIILPASREAALAGFISLCGPALEDHIDPAHLPLFVARRSPRGISDILHRFWEPQLNSELDPENNDYHTDSELDESYGVRESCQHAPSPTIGNKTYWTLFNRCLKRIGHILGSRQQQAWCENLQRRFIATHWVLPHPSSNSFVSKMQVRKTGKWKYRWWSSHHPAVTQAFPYTDDAFPPLVTAAVVPDLPVDGWIASKTIMDIRLQLPRIPSDLSAFLCKLSACATPVPPLVDGEIIFPVDTVRPRFQLSNSDSLDWQPRRLRSRSQHCVWNSATVSPTHDSSANSSSGFHRWLSQFRPIFEAEQARISQTNRPLIDFPPPLPLIPQHALPPAHEHQPRVASSPCLHTVPFDPHYSPKPRARFLSLVVAPLALSTQFPSVSSLLPLPRTAGVERGFRLQSTVAHPQPTRPAPRPRQINSSDTRDALPKMVQPLRIIDETSQQTSGQVTANHHRSQKRCHHPLAKRGRPRKYANRQDKLAAKAYQQRVKRQHEAACRRARKFAEVYPLSGHSTEAITNIAQRSWYPQGLVQMF